MSAPTPYAFLPGTAREALLFYAAVFGGTAELHTFAEFGRTDGPADAIAHGALVGAPVAFYLADAVEGKPVLRGTEGLWLALLGTADPGTLRRWFAQLAEGGTILDPLQERQWGASDGHLIDRYGIHWLIGFEDQAGS